MPVSRRNLDKVQLVKGRTILILNGPGLADLTDGGDRYAGVTLEQIRDASAALCAEVGMNLEFRQSDEYDEISRWIAGDSGRFDALIINPVGHLKFGAVDSDMYRSATEMIAQLRMPVIEVHLNNIFREGDELIRPLRGPLGETGLVCGLGLHGYLLAIKAAAKRLQG